MSFELSPDATFDGEKLLRRSSEDDSSQSVFYSKRLRGREYVASLLLRKSVPDWIFFCAMVSIVLLSGTISMLSFRKPSTQLPTTVYSPASSALERTLVAPKTNMAYFPPFTDESDRLWGRWEDIISSVGDDQAQHMDPKTWALRAGQNVFVIDVFHQLHCLNFLRKYVHPDRYHLFENISDAKKDYYYFHRDHCVESIRQSLMCNADITPNVFTLNKTSNKYFPNGQVLHSCMNFDRIEDWAAENHLDNHDLPYLADNIQHRFGQID